ncbi:helix-turn-helix transcriptional regulator [Streptomyces kanamyceticus]|uniref:DNA-binding response regulator n=1 Tax=Streptomyces kanamyceticus TaxID=1967 RepID=A0A5J6GB17_STRKN|nr:response regulator transcription factor [Streptomyces kanamyceticus]QEU90456.1 DNA-binding response regulator [Streptomyces kanamyceticus]
MERTEVPLWLDESNVIFRRGLADCLTVAGFTIVGESAGLRPLPDLGTAALLVAEADGAGLDAVARLVAERPVPLLGVLDAPRPELVRSALEHGFAGLLVRAETTPDSLVAAVDAVAAGSGSLPPAALAGLLSGVGGDALRLRAAAELLARRELDVLRLLAEGSSTREIAGTLCYSERTVKNIVHDTLAKLNCRTRAHAVAIVVRQGAL